MKKKYYKGLVAVVVAGMLLSVTGCGVTENIKEDTKELIVDMILDELGLEDIDLSDLENLDLEDLEKLQELDFENMNLEDLDESDIEALGLLGIDVADLDNLEGNSNNWDTVDYDNGDSNIGYTIEDNRLIWNDKAYDIIEVDGGDRSGDRESNVAVDIGFGDRIYWGLTNEYGQLVYVLADEITLQNDDVEPVNKNGRYYGDEAYVPGTEAKDLDQGHVIADSLGGVSNAYNITPQNSTLNRHGDQAYMEDNIRKARGCSRFIAEITYPDNKTQTPSRYRYEYTLRGNVIIDEYDNANPEK